MALRITRGQGLALLSLLAAGPACALDIEPYLATPTKRAMLFRGLPSYSSREEALRHLGLQSDPRSDKVYEGHSQGCGSRAFRYEVRLVSIEAADHGFSGPLLLTFLDNRLLRAEFRPYRPEEYLDRLLGRGALFARPLRSRSARSFRLFGAPPHTLVEIARGQDGLAVTWTDSRLLKAYWEVQSRGSSRYL